MVRLTGAPLRSGSREDPPLDPPPSFLPRTQNGSLLGGTFSLTRMDSVIVNSR